MEEADRAYVVRSWLLAAAESPFSRVVGHQNFMREHHALIERILARGACVIAAPSDHSDSIIGFSVTEMQGARRVVHFVHVRREARRNGVASALLAAWKDEPAEMSFWLESLHGVKLPKLWYVNLYRMFT
jgi:GNAT superfamily N-acetyltransferase